MWKHSIHLILGAVVLAAITGGAAYGYSPINDPALIGWWECDEGTGAIVSDSSPNGNDGSFVNGDPAWTPGVRGMAVDLVGPTLVEIPAAGLTLSEATMAGWILADGAQPEWASIIMHRGPGPASGFNMLADGHLAYHWGDAENTWSYRGDAYYVENEWTFGAVTVTSDAATFYVNGVEMSVNSVSHPQVAWDGPFWLGGDGGADWVARRMNGALDDVSFFSRALTEAEIQTIMEGLTDPTLAAVLSPFDGVTDVPRDDDLSWTPGSFAATHDVYLGTSLDDVNDASRANPMGLLVSQDQTALTYDPGRLEFGQTYYWRVDEVNAAPSSTIFKGNVWSFTVEPFAYPVENIIATANTTSDPANGPEKAVDGSGLNAEGQHSIDAADMWLGIPGADPVTIQFEFDAVYKLHQMQVWNYNVMFEMMLGFGLQDVTVEYSVDGIDWTVLGDVQFAQATARADYAANTTVDFGEAAVKYVKFTVNSGYGVLGQFGLSEVRFLYIPVTARQPQPTDGQTGVDPGGVLGWRAGREAASHEVYLSADETAVADGTALAGTVADASYPLSGLGLGLDSTFYWKVNEVNDAEAISAWEGKVWSFTTQEFFVVDGFESYGEEEGNRIYEIWEDGWVNNTGSTVGHLDAPFVEQDTVHSGGQSMPLFVDNAGFTVAEAELTLSPAQDWTANGIQSLALYFHGAADNGGQLYLKINDTRVDYGGDASDIARANWQPWLVDLSAVAGNLSNVTKLTIGVQGAGVTGVVYIDDIHLYPRAVETITPAEPDTANLVAHYAFEGTLGDSAGNGFNGVATGDPTYGAGVEGQALQLDGVIDYVAVADVGINGAMPRTIAGWAKADVVALVAWTNVFGFTGAATNGQHFDIEAVGDSGANATLGYYGLHRHGWERDIIPIDLEWHHLAATYDGEVVAWYGDGQLIGSDEVDPADVATPGAVHIGKRQDNENLFQGMVDDVRIYDVALSAGEIAGLAGRTAPLYKPF